MSVAPTIHARVSDARRRLREAGIAGAEADLDARLIAQRLLGWDAARFLTSAHDHEGPPAFPARYEALVERRARREPVAHLIGAQEFWGRMFDVTPAVLIPRPESELIVETALELLPDRGSDVDIADVGTGSGCLAVSLALEFSNARVLATDISPDAVLVATGNAVRHGVDARIRFAVGDLFSQDVLHLVGPGLFDLIVSNPPYVPERDRSTLQPEVREHEPAAALFGGEDGLAVIRNLIPQASERLEARGFLVFEFGYSQADAVSELISHAPGLTMVGLKRDLQGTPRVAVARRHHG
jgi:release factor glutamine methyltransferase